MDEYTALQKYILFYRDTRTNPHAEKSQKKKAWWQFWKSGSATAAEPIEDAGAVPDERKSSSTPLTCSFAIAQSHAADALPHPTADQLLAHATFVVLIRWLHFGVRAQAASFRACAAAAVERIRGDPHTCTTAPTELQPAVQHPRWSSRSFRTKY